MHLVLFLIISSGQFLSSLILPAIVTKYKEVLLDNVHIIPVIVTKYKEVLDISNSSSARVVQGKGANVFAYPRLNTTDLAVRLRLKVENSEWIGCVHYLWASWGTTSVYNTIRQRTRVSKLTP